MADAPPVTDGPTAGPPPDELDGVDLESWGIGTNNATGITNNKLGMWLFLGSDATVERVCVAKTCSTSRSRRCRASCC